MLGAELRTAIVTGANKGIGWHVAQQLVQAGVQRVVVACRDPELGRRAASELSASFLELDLASEASIDSFPERFSSEFGGSLDVLVNNAGMAFKDSDPTPFEQQTGPTLLVNFWGTARLTDCLLPLLRRNASEGRRTRVVNVASMIGRLGQVSPELQQKFSAPDLDRTRLAELVRKFEADVVAGRHREEGWSSSNYGFSKLALIAFTKVVAREEAASMRVNACCPGYCDTDMSSHKGPRPPDVGARNAVKLALLPDDAPTGEFWQNEEVSAW